MLLVHKAYVRFADCFCSQDELELVRRVQMGLLPNDIQDPYPDTVEYFTSIEEKMRKPTSISPLQGVFTNVEQLSAPPPSPSGASSPPRTRPSRS